MTDSAPVGAAGPGAERSRRRRQFFMPGGSGVRGVHGGVHDLARSLAAAVVVVLAVVAGACTSTPTPGVDTQAPGGRDSARRQVALVVTGGSVVTMDESRRVLQPGAVAIDGRQIVAVGTPDEIDAAFDASDRIDAPSGIVLPGLINTHTHAPMVLYRGLADDLALMEWLEQHIFPAEARTVSPAFVAAGTRLAALEMIRSGTTTFADMYYFEEVIAEATRAAGLRAVLGQTVIRFPVADAPTPEDALARADAFIRQYRDDDLIVPAVAPHAMYTLAPETLQAARALADRHGVPLLIHLAETRDEYDGARREHGRTPTAYLAAHGVLGPNVLGAHGVWLDPPDIATVAEHGTSISHNPESNMKLASGTAPVSALLAAGVKVGLGTDGAASNNDLDMFEAMRTAALLHKLVEQDPRALPAPTVLEMATRMGAEALGLGDRVGSLVPGKRADVIVVETARPHMTPMYDPVSHLVYTAKGSDVTTTIVNGRVLMRDRRVLTLDEAAVLEEARTMSGRVRASD